MIDWVVILTPTFPEDTSVVFLDHGVENPLHVYDPVYSLAETEDAWLVEGVSFEYEIDKIDGRTFEVRRLKLDV